MKITTFMQATEDRQKVIEAVKNVMIGEIPVEISFSNAEGIFHNPIEQISAELNRSRDIERIVTAWSRMRFWSIAASRIEDRLDENMVYHIRLDKQKAYNGEFSLWNGGEAVELQLKPATFPISREKAVETILQEALDRGSDK